MIQPYIQTPYNAAYLWSSDFFLLPLWVADYNVNQPESTGPWDSWDGFQYSDRDGYRE